MTDFIAELALHGEEQPVTTRQLAAGTWLIEVREIGIDLSATIEIAGKLTTLLDSTPRHGITCWLVSLTDPAELRVVLRSTDHFSKRGTGVVRIARFRRAQGQAADARELGYQAWSEAAEQHALKTPEAWARSADKLNEAVRQFDSAGDQIARAQAAYALATLQYSARNDWAAAIRAAEIAADSFEDSEDEVGSHNAAVVRAAAELELASAMNAETQRAELNALYAAADRRLAEAAEFFTAHDLPIRAAYATNMRGVGALNVGEDEAAADFFSKAVAISRVNDDVSEQARSLGNLAWVHRLRGLVAQAAEEYAQLKPLVDAERQPYAYGVLLNNYGFCLIALGDFDRALALHTEALDVFTRIGAQGERATQLAALGVLYFRVGDPARALQTLRAAISEQEKVSDTRGLAGTLRVAGNAASTLGQHDLALDYLRRSARIDANPHDVMRTRVLIAGELRAVGDYRAADQALADALRSENAMVRADALAERARLKYAQQDAAAAIADLRAADTAYRELAVDFNRIQTGAMLSQLLLDAGDLAGAAKAADEAIALVSDIRANSANPEWRARFLSTQYSPFEARIAVDLAQGGDAQAAAWRAFRTADAVRARSLNDQIASGPSSRSSSQDPEANKLRAMLTAQQLRLEIRIQRPEADAAGNMELRREIEETRAKLDARLARADAVASREAWLPESLEQVQRQLPSDTVVLAYFVGDTSSHAWLLSRRQLKHASLPGRTRLQQVIELTASGPPGSSAAIKAERELGKLLFADLLAGVDEHRMLVVPDGVLNGVPFAALPVANGSGQLLVDRYLIGYAPSLKLALESATRDAGAKGVRVAVISDPVYAADDRRLRSGNSGTFRGNPQQSINKLTRLPYSALEARAVVDTFGRKDTIELAGFDATPERVLGLGSADLAVLHFATHAVARKDSPERSALFLSEYAPDGRLLEDSQLTAGEILRSGLRARLVVLSGCATGDGSTLRGEGVLGLTYGFLANGTHSVVASLWPVEDATTARFMNEFYRAYRSSGSAAEALRSAQLRTRGNPAAAAVWSSFVVRTNGFP